MFFIIVTRREYLLTILWFSQYVKLLSIDKIFKMGLKFENYDNLPALFCLSSILLIERWLGTGRDVRKKLLKMKIQNHKMLTSCPGSQGDITRPVQLYRLENCKIPSWKKKTSWILSGVEVHPGSSLTTNQDCRGAEPTNMNRPRILPAGQGRIRLNYSENVGYLWIF